MKNVWICAALWAVTVGVGYWIGSETGAGSPTGPDELTTDELGALRAENARLRKALEPGPELLGSGVPSVGGPGPGPDEMRGEASMTASAAASGPLPTFSMEDLSDPDQLLRDFMAYAAALLVRGEAGHLELIRTLNEIFQNRELQQAFGNDEQSVPYMYKLVKFAIVNEAQVVDLTETLYKTMAEKPQTFEGIDKDTFEMFTEGVAVILPAMVSDQRLRRFRGYAQQILTTPEGDQPKGVRRVRNDVERAMAFWVGGLTPDEALQRLESGEAPPREIVSLLNRLTPEQKAAVDVGALLGPAIEQGDYNAMRAIRALPPDARTLATLDRHLIDGAGKGSVRDWHIRTYLDSSGRGKWDQARPLVETGLAQGGKATDVFAMSLLRLPERPGVEWVRWAVDRYDVSPSVSQMLKKRFGF